MLGRKKKANTEEIPFPGVPVVMEGDAAVVACEREVCEASPLPPPAHATRTAALWGEASASGALNGFGRPLLAVDSGEGSALLSTLAGLTATGLRSIGFISPKSLVGCGEALEAIAGQHLPTVLHPSGAGGADPAAPGWFQLSARDVQTTADLSLIAHRIAEAALMPGLVWAGRPGVMGAVESILLPERELMRRFLGAPGEQIESPTPAQRMVFGPTRRRIPRLWNVDDPAASGLPLGREVAGQAAAARVEFYETHLPTLAEAAFAGFHALTGRRYGRLSAYRAEDAAYLIVARGAVVPLAQAVADHLRQTHKIKTGVVEVVLAHPFPGDLLGFLLQGRSGVLVLDQQTGSMGADPPLLREVRGVLQRCLENGRAEGLRRKDSSPLPHPGFAAYRRLEEAPALHGAMASQARGEIEAAALIAAVELMLPDGAGLRRVYLSASFHREPPRSPREEIALQTLHDAYPHLREMGVLERKHSAAIAPQLLPIGAVTVRLQGHGGPAVWTAEDNPAHTLFELAGLQVKGGWLHPAHVSNASGHPANWEMTAARQTPANGGAAGVADVLLSPRETWSDLNGSLSGLKDGGALILQSAQGEPEALWKALPLLAREAILARGLRVYVIDALGMAMADAHLPEEAARFAGRILQGALLQLPEIVALTGLSGKALLRSIKEVLRDRHEDTDLQAAEEDFLRYQQGLEGLWPLEPMSAAAEAPEEEATAPEMGESTHALLPGVLKNWPQHDAPVLDAHRLWGDVGSHLDENHARNGAGEALAEPFLASGLLPAASAMLRDFSPETSPYRGLAYPRWLPESCTGCGACWMVCPDSALPGLVSGLSEVLETALGLVVAQGQSAKQLPRAVRTLESKLRARLLSGAAGAGEADAEALGVNAHLEAALSEVLAESRLDGADKADLTRELGLLKEALGGFPLTMTEPYFTAPEKAARGTGGLLSVTLDPGKCKGCQACIVACPEGALVPAPLEEQNLDQLRRHWAFWRALPNTDTSHLHPGAAEGAVPGLESLLLDKRAYHAMSGGEGGAPGAGERTVLHLFAAMIEGQMRPRVTALVARLDGLIEDLERHIRLNLAVNVEDPQALQKAMGALGEGDFTLSQLSEQMDVEHNPVNVEWLRRVTGLLSGLQELRARYTRQGSVGQTTVGQTTVGQTTVGQTTLGRASLGVVQDAAEAAGWGLGYPFNPFPFPWSGSGSGNTSAWAVGIFEGHMAQMAEGFKTLRATELELEGKYNPELHDSYFARFDWREFNAEEFALCPPVVIAGGAQTFAGGGAQGVSSLLRSGRPVKLLHLEDGAYRHLLGAGSGRFPSGDAVGIDAGRETPALPLEGALTGGVFIAQCSLGNLPHLMQSFRAGLASTRPTLFKVYQPLLPGNGLGAYQAVGQSRLAVEARAHPLFRFDPDAEGEFHQCLSLEGNPALDDDWAALTAETLAMVNNAMVNNAMVNSALPNGALQNPAVEGDLTFAAYAASLPGLGHHFQALPAEAPAGELTPLTEYLALETDEREGCRPFIEVPAASGDPLRLLVSQQMSRACGATQQRWRTLRDLVRRDVVPVDEDAISEQARMEMVEQVTRSLITLAQNGAGTTRLAELAGLAPTGGSTEGVKSNV